MCLLVKAINVSLFERIASPEMKANKAALLLFPTIHILRHRYRVLNHSTGCSIILRGALWYFTVFYRYYIYDYTGCSIILKYHSTRKCIIIQEFVLKLCKVLYHYTGYSIILQGALSFYRVFYHSTGCSIILQGVLSFYRVLL